MLILKNMNTISQQIYGTIEEQFVKSLAADGRGLRYGLARKMSYFMWLTTCHLHDITSAPYPTVRKERHRVHGELLDIAFVDMRISNRRKKPKPKTLVIPIFLDAGTNREDNTTTFYEKEMWDVITDSWSHDVVKLDFSKMNGYNNAKKSLEHVLDRTAMKCVGHLDKIVDKPIMLTYLRPWRFYDLLYNKREYGMNTDVIVKMLGLSNPIWLVRSVPYGMAINDTDTLDLLKG